MKLSPQCELIYQHLRRGHSITTLDAMRPPFNCCRLSERIRELEAAKIAIDHTPIKTPSGKRVMAYTLRGGLFELAEGFVIFGQTKLERAKELGRQLRIPCQGRYEEDERFIARVWKESTVRMIQELTEMQNSRTIGAI